MVSISDLTHRNVLIQEDTKACYVGGSKQMLLYNMYAATQMTFLKAYIMAQSAWLIMDAQDKGNHRGKLLCFHSRSKPRPARRSTLASISPDQARHISPTFEALTDYDETSKILSPCYFREPNKNGGIIENLNMVEKFG